MIAKIKKKSLKSIKKKPIKKKSFSLLKAHKLKARRPFKFGKSIKSRLTKNAKNIKAQGKKHKINSFGFLNMFLKGLKAAGCFLLILSLVASQTIFVAGYEAHVINVTAKICNYSETRTIGYWKNYPEIYKHLLPQILGGETIDTAAEADYILNFSGDENIMRNKLKAQLLAMKFNIFYYHIGGYYVESAGKTLNEIVPEADALIADPYASLDEMREMKDLLDDLNNLHQIRSCPSGIVINEFLPNPPGNDNAPMPDGEWVELYNIGNAEIDLDGWALYDLHDDHELLITALNTDTGGTIIKPKGFLTVYRNGDADFSLNNTLGDAVRLYNDTIDKGVLIDIYAYTVDALEGKSFARIPDGSANWVDPLPTPGKPNSIEGENLAFGPAALEDGEDTEVLNTDMEIKVQEPEIILFDDLVLPSSDVSENMPENTADAPDSVSVSNPVDFASNSVDPAAEAEYAASNNSDQLADSPPQTEIFAIDETANEDQGALSGSAASNDGEEINNSAESVDIGESFSDSAAAGDIDLVSGIDAAIDGADEAIEQAESDAVEDSESIDFAIGSAADMDIVSAEEPVSDSSEESLAVENDILPPIGDEPATASSAAENSESPIISEQETGTLSLPEIPAEIPASDENTENTDADEITGDSVLIAPILEEEISFLPEPPSEPSQEPAPDHLSDEPAIIQKSGESALPE